ncbi:MAG: diacylglycerol kinase [Lentilitoribacter sp.]
MSVFGSFSRIFSATKNSVDGILVLIKEPAARQEMIFGGLALLALILIGSEFFHLVIFTILLLIILAVETLNTAIECVVDRVSPEISDFGKKTKDQGSTAVAFTLAAAGIYWLYAVCAAFGVFS